MATQFEFRPIVPGQAFDIEGFVKRLTKIVDTEIDIVERMYNGVTKNWTDKNKPNWTKRKAAVRGDDFGADITTNSTPFIFLELGTSKRWAVMDRSFVPKTRHRVLGSRETGPSERHVVLRGRRAMHRMGLSAMPGIKSREWGKEIVKRRKPKFEKKVINALIKSVRLSNARGITPQQRGALRAGAIVVS